MKPGFALEYMGVDSSFKNENNVETREKNTVVKVLALYVSKGWHHIYFSEHLQEWFLGTEPENTWVWSNKQEYNADWI